MDTETRDKSALGILATTPVMKELDWVEILKRRIIMMYPYLNTMTLTNLGNVDCMHMYGQAARIALSNDEPEVRGDSGYRLHRIEGLFDISTYEVRFDDEEDFVSHHNHQGELSNHKKGQKRFWGLLRNGETVTITVSFDIVHDANGVFEKVWKIVVHETSLSKLVPVWQGYLMWSFLNNVCREWEERIRNRFERAQELFEVVSTEKMVFDLRFVR